MLRARRSAAGEPTLVSFPSGNLTLRGFVHTPPADRPLPAMIFNHGSEPSPDRQPGLADFYGAAGYVLFTPHRRGHGRSPGRYALGDFAEDVRLRPPADDTDRQRAIQTLIELLELHLQDTLAAAAWLARQPYVDPDRIAMSGVSHGGVQTLLAAEAGAGVRAHVAFGPGAIGWNGNPELQDRLLRAVAGATAPVFLIQAENDYDLGPSRVLGAELDRRGPLDRVQVYPAYGTDHFAGHAAFACAATDVWGADVLGFLAAAGAA